jgi:Ca2+/Na+ antiporter
MEFIIYILVYLVGMFVTYIAHYYYIAYLYSKSKQIQSKYYFGEYTEETSLSRSIISFFWLFVVLLAPIG